MARICQNCAKKVMRGNKVARARQELLYRSPKSFKPNLHSARIKQADGSTIRLTLCTKCLRMAKQYAAATIANSTKASSSGIISK